ncbi:VOC family protein [Fictibacillus nanhaiensis]|uniref:VOC family protein n=1 Tax=Fictibacillus nanhaiensis TaxID=742169 RepID=A0ABS2ZSF3_9BACL|nr:VOC family protein [Fictibacillus nanhaiensis]
MNGISFAISQITIAYNQEDEMVDFYNQLLNAELSPFKVGDFRFYKGKIGEIGLLFCPNEMLGIKAEKNNIQFTVQVSNLEEILSKASQCGGKQIQGINREESRSSVGILDPDGNSIELLEI